jgi:hypothetical protein
MTKPALPDVPAIDSLYADNRQLVERARAQVLTQVNQALVLTYWQICQARRYKAQELAAM